MTDSAVRMMRQAKRGPKWTTERRKRRKVGKGSRPRGFYLIEDVIAYEREFGRP